MEQIQMVGISPQQLQDAISNDVKNQLEELKKNFEPKNPEEYLTRRETAKLLKVDLSTIRNHCKRGLLKPVGLGGRVYFKRSEVEESLIEL
nr:helix-turn-helix domain-containing protein [uncultured Allomuricauda sp.]